MARAFECTMDVVSYGISRSVLSVSGGGVSRGNRDSISWKGRFVASNIGSPVHRRNVKRFRTHFVGGEFRLAASSFFNRPETAQTAPANNL